MALDLEKQPSRVGLKIFHKKGLTLFLVTLMGIVIFADDDTDRKKGIINYSRRVKNLDVLFQFLFSLPSYRCQV